MTETQGSHSPSRVIVVDGQKRSEVALPDYGEVKIAVQNGRVVRVDTTSQQKF